MNDGAIVGAIVKEILEERGPDEDGRRRHGNEPPPCVECRLHAAKIGDEKARNYHPPLGVTFAIPATSGGFVYICPRCSKFELDDGTTTNLLGLGVHNRRTLRAIVKKGFKLRV